jgi:hypothetical protein
LNIGAEDRVFARRASGLASINSLLLRTLPAIDYDILDYAKDPCRPRPNENPVPTAPSLDILIDR